MRGHLAAKAYRALDKRHDRTCAFSAPFSPLFGRLRKSPYDVQHASLGHLRTQFISTLGSKIAAPAKNSRELSVSSNSFVQTALAARSERPQGPSGVVGKSNLAVGSKKMKFTRLIAAGCLLLFGTAAFGQDYPS